MHPGSRTTPLTDEARSDFAANAAALVRAVPGRSARHRRQRAQPEPVLAPAVRARRDQCRASRVPRAARPDLRRAEGRFAGVRVYGGALSPRGGDRAGGTRPTHSPTKFIQELGIAYRASGRDRPAMDALRDPSVSGQLEPAARRPPIPTRRRSGSPTTTSSSRSSRRHSTAPRSPGSALPILYAEFGVESRDPSREGGALHGRRAGDDASRRRGDPGRRTTDRRSLWPSVSRRSRGCCSSSPATNARARAGSRVCTTWTGRPKASLPRVTEAARSHDRRFDRALPRRSAHRPAEPPPLRHADRREARRVPRKPPLRSRLQLRAAGRDAHPRIRPS